MVETREAAEHIATSSFWISRKRKRDQLEPPRRTLNFPKLFDGAETDFARDLRRDTFEQLWREQESVINDILATFHDKIKEELSDFVRSAGEEEPVDRIPSAVILAGNNLAGHTRLFTQIKEQLKNVMEGPVVVISAVEASNLQGLLRKIVSGCLQVDISEDEEDEIQTSKNAKLRGRLPYDLEIIEEWCQSQRDATNFRIVIAFQDTEAFPANLISDFILRNHARLSRLPIVLLFGVASTLDQFQNTLPTSVIKSLDTKVFEVRQNDDCLKIIIDNVLMEEGVRLRLGPKVLSLLVDRYNSWNQSVEEFISGLKYAYMCHFYANPLSVLLAIPSIDQDSLQQYLTTTHLDAIRSLPSMKKYVEEKLAEKDTEEVKSILLDNTYLISLLPQFVEYLESKARELREAIIVLVQLSERGVKTKRGLAELYLSVLAGEVTSQTPFLRELLQLQRKFSSTSLVEFLSRTIEALPESELQYIFQQYLEETEALAEDAQSVPSVTSKLPQRSQKHTLTSGFDIQSRPGMRSTKVSQKLRQEKDRANMTSEDEEYTKLVESLNEILKEVFLNLAPQDNVPLYEVFYFNVTKTHFDVFSAQPRESHKTAFRNPAHWLHCSCCTKNSEQEAILQTQPVTSILHQLYLDSTTGLINLYDWFSAFSQIKQGEKDEQTELSEEQLYASFMANLDELVWMGYVKRTMRKTDHVEKLVGG